MSDHAERWFPTEAALVLDLWNSLLLLFIRLKLEVLVPALKDGKIDISHTNRVN